MSYYDGRNKISMIWFIPAVSVASTLVLRSCEMKLEIFRLSDQVEERVDCAVAPEIRDVNGDGFEDIVLGRYNCEDLVLYGTRDGNYIFGED
ncbi:MAG: hypothetical protein ABH864_06920 [archaeon]